MGNILSFGIILFVCLSSEWDNPFQPEGSLSKDAERMVSMWKEGTLGQEYREDDDQYQDTASDASKDTLENMSDENPQVSGNILPRKPLAVDMLDKSDDKAK